MRAKVKVTFQLRPETVIAQSRGVEYYPFEIIYGVHGMSENFYQWLPDDTRYYMVPVLPALSGAEERKHFEALPP